MTCEHPKERGCLWCRECGEKIAGPKPECVWQVGWLAKPCHDWDRELGEVIGVEMYLMGLATPTPRWGEQLKLTYPSGSGSGTASLFKHVEIRDV